MVRKASDLFSLLSSRGRGRRSRSGGWFRTIGGLVGGLLPRRRVDPVAARGSSVPGYAAVALAALSLLVGYVCGTVFPFQRGAAELNAGTSERREPQKPGPVNPVGARRTPTATDTEILTQEALCVAKYEGDGSDAVLAADYLRQHGLQRARVYRVWFQDGTSAWTTVVYYDGERDRGSVEQKLREIASPDPTYESFKIGPSWPFQLAIRKE
ncbi:MAG: hypothetical protein IPK26_11960 [Planctomycetes bacterium]|nr:hypothetical protein [Planctomycetota bacterium]